MYVAGKPQKIERVVDGKTVTVTVNPGDPVPECTSWPTFKACLNTGHIVWQPPHPSAKPPKGLPDHAVVGGSSRDDDDEDDAKVRVAPVAAAKPPKRAKIQKEAKPSKGARA